MNKNLLYAIVSLVVVVVVVAAAAVLVSGDDEDDSDDSSSGSSSTSGSTGASDDDGYDTDDETVAIMALAVTVDDAVLKVYGNIDGDMDIDEDDVAILEAMISAGASAEDYPFADANQDGCIDDGDVAVLTAVIEGEATTIWHINYHDTDEDGVMDEEVVSTAFPITSIICTGAPSTFLLLFMLGIVDEVKGASYGSSADTALFGDTYLNTDLVACLGTNYLTITFEDGQAGSSDVIATAGVTAVVSDWSKTHLTNESDFEDAGIDVVRVSAGAIDLEYMRHSALLLGLLFQKMDRAVEYVELTEEIYGYVELTVEGADTPAIIASSMTGYISSSSSDYTRLAEMAGAVYALDDGVDFSGTTVIKIADHPEVYGYDIDYIVHVRTALSYGLDEDTVAGYWETYTAAFEDWQYADTGQVMVSGTVPVAVRLAYVAYAIHPDLIDLDRVNGYHQALVDAFYNGLEFDVSSMYFVVIADIAANFGASSDR